MEFGVGVSVILEICEQWKSCAPQVSRMKVFLVAVHSACLLNIREVRRGLLPSTGFTAIFFDGNDGFPAQVGRFEEQRVYGWYRSDWGIL